MDSYLLLRLVHILSATILFGTGLGTAFFMWRADRAGDVAAIAITARHVVLADWLFTAPAVIVQPLTGFLLLREAGYEFSEGWVLLSLVLYVVAGTCWLPVVWLQKRMRDIAVGSWTAGADLPPLYHRYMRIWFALGWPAFVSLVAIFALMVIKPSL